MAIKDLENTMYQAFKEPEQQNTRTSFFEWKCSENTVNNEKNLTISLGIDTENIKGPLSHLSKPALVEIQSYSCDSTAL